MLSMLVLGQVQAQQTPPANPSSKPASGQSTGSAAKTPAKKAPASSAKTGAAVTLKTQKEKASYALGMSIGTGMHRQGLPVDPALVSRGLRDAMAGGKTLMTEDEMKAALQQLRGQVQQAQESKTQAESAGNRKAGEAFLTANKSKEGVKTLPDGLQYKILKEGDGPKPNAEDSVVCNYKGTLLNNTEFDSSYKRGQPATFPVSGVIKGWTEVLQMMPVGSKWQIFVPPDLAYGARGNGGIGPSATLIFEIELLSIQAKEAK